MTPRTALHVALAALVVTMVVATAIPWVGAGAGGASGLRPGFVLGVVKVAVLAVVFSRVRDEHVYSMQWSSMLILLFVAEGVVRATSDAAATRGLGAVQAIAAGCAFAALLVYLRPLKKRARDAQPPGGRE